MAICKSIYDKKPIRATPASSNFSLKIAQTRSKLAQSPCKVHMVYDTLERLRHYYRIIIAVLLIIKSFFSHPAKL